MADDRTTPNPNPAIDDPHTGTTRERDFGRTDRYENKDKDFNVRDTGDEDPDDPSSGVNRDER
jgi:hypothetical protein